MTAKHYRLIAKHLNVEWQAIGDLQMVEEVKDGFYLALQSLSQALVLDNPRFDCQRFINTIMGSHWNNSGYME